MIDTIIMTLSKPSFEILDHSKFNPNTRDYMSQLGFHKFVNNPTKKDKYNGIYKPKLTLLKRGLKVELKIEFSAPKILFNNNLEEINESMFDKLVFKLRERILDMGVKVSIEALKNANVIGIHPSKNVILNNGYTSTFAIGQLSKVDLNQKLDLTKTSFRNDGKSLQFYSKSHSLVLYDKVSDLNQTNVRSIDTDNTIQKNLFNNINIRNKEILRIEVRITNKRKLLQILESLDIKNDLIFETIISENLCKSIIKFYINKYLINQGTLFLFDKNNGPQRILGYILDCSNLSFRHATSLLALSILGKDERGIRGLRETINQKRPKTNWSRLKKDFKILQDEKFIANPHGFIKDILDQIKKFDNFRIKNI